MLRNATMLSAVLSILASALIHAQSPVPFVNLPLVPDTIAPGGAQFTLTVNGTGFVSNSIVSWNGIALATQYVTSSQLTATVPPADIVKAGTASVTVVNPATASASNVVLFTVTPNRGDNATFNAAPPAITGGNSISVAVGDFNGDRKQDLAIANQYTDFISVLVGDGAGNFTPISSAAGGIDPISLALGDFNGDGKLDMAFADQFEANISVLLGDGAGNFTLTSSPGTGANPRSVAAGDFNGDGKLDLAVASEGNSSVSVLLGDGTGNFTQASSIATAGSPLGLAVGDFNRDGKLDVAAVNFFGGVSVLVGDGAGNLTLASSPAAGTNPVAVAAGDFNGDGKLDLAVINLYGPASVLLGDGAGGFTLVSSPTLGYYPQDVALGDFNGDGILDWAVPIYYDNTVDILLGDGNGNFTLAAVVPTGGENPQAVAVGDFNADGLLDIVLANWSSGNASVLLGRFPVGVSPTSLTFGAQLIGTSSTAQTVILTNSSTAAVDISSITGSVNFTQTSDCGSSLAAGTSCTITVKFQPRGTGTLAGTITIRDNAANSPQTVSLTGVGTAVSLTPSSLSFGKQTVGTTSKAQSVTLSNSGTKALHIQGIHIVGSNSVNFAQTNNCGTSVAAGGTCGINVTFTPKSKGLKTATISVGDDGGASPQTAALSGTGK